MFWNRVSCASTFFREPHGSEFHTIELIPRRRLRGPRHVHAFGTAYQGPQPLLQQGRDQEKKVDANVLKLGAMTDAGIMATLVSTAPTDAQLEECS